MSPSRINALRYGRSGLNLSEIPGYLSSHGDVFDPLTTSHGKSMMSNLAGQALELANKATGLGSRVAKHGKPLAWGFGGALAISAALSGPVSNLEAGAPIVNADMRGGYGDSVRSDNIHPDMPAMGQPTAPDILQSSPPQIRKNDQYMSAMINVRARTKRPFNAGNVNANVKQLLGAGTTVNTRVYDDRRSLTAQNITDILNR